MFNLWFGFAIGSFICWLIAKFHNKESNWIQAKYIFLISLMLLATSILMGWPLLKQVFG